MNANEINKIAKNDIFASQIFEGVFSSDTLPQILIKNKCYIMNLDKSTENGRHWVLFHCTEKCTFYFDSFGNKPQTINVYKAMLASTSQIYYNNIQVQSYYTTVCGYHTLVFLFLIARGFEMKEILENFYDLTGGLYKNDIFSVRFISEIAGIEERPIVDLKRILL